MPIRHVLEVSVDMRAGHDELVSFLPQLEKKNANYTDAM
jgi:hypothetical protein